MGAFASEKSTCTTGINFWSIEAARNVADLHRLACRQAMAPGSVVPLTCDLLGVHPATPIAAVDIETMLLRFAASIGEDLEAGHSREVAAGLTQKLLRPPVPRHYAEVFGQVERVYRAVGRAWAPLLATFIASVMHHCDTNGITDAVYLARDGLLLDVVHRGVAARRTTAVASKVLDLNRRMVGVDDPAMSMVAADGVVRRHVEAILPASGRVALVDTGQYGTLVLKMAELGLLGDSLVLFFSSRNPHIFGFLQSLGLSGEPDDFATVCCDTLEAWPKLYRTASLASLDGRTVALARLSDPISICGQLALARSLFASCARLRLDVVDPLAELAELRKPWAAGPATDVSVILSKPMAQWPGADTFLQKEWNVGPVPPVAGLFGPEFSP